MKTEREKFEAWHKTIDSDYSTDWMWEANSIEAKSWTVQAT
jgi:hypothetical protein